MADYKKLISECDTQIKSGQAQAVAVRLSSMKLNRVPRPWRLPLAQICRRAGVAKLGLTLLKNLVYPRRAGKSQAEATANELAEYGILLLRIGATKEAERILLGVDSVKAHEAHQYRAMVYITLWNYEKAIPELIRFLNLTSDPYTQLVAKMNLAIAYVESAHYPQAQKILDELIEVSNKSEATLILLTALSYRAQLHTQQGLFKEARRDLLLGQSYIQSRNVGNPWPFTKWKLILDALENQSLAPLDELRKLAREGRNWEDVRLADLYSVRLKFDMSLYLRLIFGTPYAGFRKRLEAEANLVSDRKIFYLGPKNAPRFDLRTGRIRGGSKIYEPLMAGGKSHQLLDVLLRDFYQPLRLAGIFTELFPGEHFDPQSSPDRVHAVLVRTRHWLTKNQIPLAIEESDGFYSLKIEGDFSFLIPLERSNIDLMSLHFGELRSRFAGRGDFTAREVRKELKLARQTVQRILNWGIERGLIERQGENQSVNYRLSTKAA